MALNNDELLRVYCDLHKVFPEDVPISRPLIHLFQQRGNDRHAGTLESGNYPVDATITVGGRRTDTHYPDVHGSVQARVTHDGDALCANMGLGDMFGEISFYLRLPPHAQPCATDQLPRLPGAHGYF